MAIKLLKDLDFASKLSVAEPVTEAAQNVVKNYRAYLFMNAANCAVVNNFIKEAGRYAYDKGMSKILESVMSFINENRISWQLASACENISNNNTTYAYIAKIGVAKVEKLLEMNESDVVAYIKAGALKGVKYIPEFREICKEVYKTQVNESAQTATYEMHTPFCYSIVNESGDHVVMVNGKTYAVNASSVKECECNDETFIRINEHLKYFKQVGEAIEYTWNDITFSINEGKLTMKRGDKVLESFDSETKFMKYCDTYSRAIMNGKQLMSIAGAVAEVYENADDINSIDNARVFTCSNGSKAAVIECKDNVMSIANGVVAESQFMVEALDNVNKQCGIDVKMIYEGRINEDLKKGDPEQYNAIQEELEKTKNAQAEIRYRKIERLAEALKNNPAAIAVLNTLTKELRMLDEGK